MANGRKGRYRIRKKIADVLCEAASALTADEIKGKLADQRRVRGGRFRNTGYSANSISQMLRGAQGIDVSTSTLDKNMGYRKVKSFKVQDEESLYAWVESKRKRRVQ